MNASNSIMPMRIFFEDNITTHKVGLIFVNTTIEINSKKLPWKNAVQNGAAAERLLREAFGFIDVKVYTDASKEKIITAYNDVQGKADSFEKTKKGKETMLVSVFWIGHTWYQSGHRRQYKLNPADKGPGKCADGTNAPI